VSSQLKTMELSVDLDRLMSRHHALAKIGATGRGGVCRPALGPEDTAARRLLLDWARARSFSCAIDPIGNLFVRRNGGEPGWPPVSTGSHLDTQIPGGNYDGIYGVIAGLEVLETLEDHDISTRRPIELVVWNNEEGARFSPTTMGSSVYSGATSIEAALESCDREGISVRKALAESLSKLGNLDQHAFGAPCHAYIEAHIEQGPVLEAEGLSIGVVTGIQGISQFQTTITGEAAHAGTTPRRRRRDALLAAMSQISGLAKLAEDPGDKLRFTIGKLTVLPGTPNTVPSEVAFTIDLRHPQREALDAFRNSIERICGTETLSCKSKVNEFLNSPPIDFDARVRSVIRDAAIGRGASFMELASGATHDAKYMAKLCPTSMIFIPCLSGISHNEAEMAAPSDMECGANVLLDAIKVLADETASPIAQVPA